MSHSIDCLVMDCLGPLFSNQKVEYNYTLVLCDSNTRYLFAVLLRTLTAKSVCNALLQVFQLVGIPSTIRSDCASNFTSSLTTTFLKILGCSPNFNVPGRPQYRIGGQLGTSPSFYYIITGVGR